MIKKQRSEKQAYNKFYIFSQKLNILQVATFYFYFLFHYQIKVIYYQFTTIFSNNDKMIKISQSNINFSEHKSSRLKNLNQIDFKICQPKSQHKINRVPIKSQIKLNKDKLSKNILKPNDSQIMVNLSTQYISFKLKPSNQSMELLSLAKDKQKGSHEKKFSNSPLDKKNGKQNYSQLCTLTKSPQFFFQSSSQSMKQSFAEQQSLNPFKRHTTSHKSNKKSNQKAYQIFKNQQTKKLIFQNQLKEKQNSRQRSLKGKSTFQDSVIVDNFQECQIFTPCKDLRQQFMRQEKQYQKEMQFRQFDDFDSFSNKYQQSRNYNYKNDNRQFEQISKPREPFIHRKDTETFLALKKHVNQNNISPSEQKNKEGFFFLTNPAWTSQKKFIQAPFNNDIQVQQNILSEQKLSQVKQFCFSLSSINLQNQNEIQIGYNKNLFSNSNQHLHYFNSKQMGAISQLEGPNSKKIHIKKLVQQFVEQLEYLDEGSLNQKVVTDLEDVLQSIVFKQTKSKQANHSHQNKHNQQKVKKIIQDEYPSKKWQKHNFLLETSNVLTERKQKLNFNYLQMIRNNASDIKQKRNFLKLNETRQKRSYQRGSHFQKDNNIQRNVNKSNDSSEKSTTRKQKTIISVYKPNFSRCQNKNLRQAKQKQKEKIKQKQNRQNNNSFSQLKMKTQCSPIKINPKSSIYVNKSSKNNKQSLKAMQNFPKNWRRY